MPRLRQRDTGSVVNVPDEKVDAWLGIGDYELVQDESGTKTAPKKAAAKKSSK